MFDFSTNFYGLPGTGEKGKDARGRGGGYQTTKTTNKQTNKPTAKPVIV